MSDSERASAPRFGALLVALLCVGLPLARGGVGNLSLLSACALSGLALATSARGLAFVPLVGLPVLGSVMVVALQIVPLPTSMHPLSPEAQRVFIAILQPIGLYPAPRPLSLDPPSTARSLTLAIACLAAFLSASAIAETVRRRRMVVRGLAAGTVLVAVAALLAALFGFTPVLAPSYPFVNPNHLGGFMALGSPLLLALALRSHGQDRLLWLIGFAAATAVGFLSLSRGAIGAIGLGLVLFVSLSSRQDRPGESPPRHRWILVAGLTAALAMAGTLALDPVIRELRTLEAPLEESKVALWPTALRMIREYPLIGIGRGAFEEVFPAYKANPEQVTYTHLENEWLSAVVELGIPGGLLLVGGLLLTWLGAARRRDLGRVEIGLLAGTGALAAQNIFDFSLVLPGVAIPFAVSLGLLTGGQRRVPLRSSTLRVATAAATLVGLGSLLVWRQHAPGRDSAAVASAADVDAVVEAGKLAAAWHPVDYVIQATPGVRAVEADRCALALPWLTRSMLLSPTAPEPHLHVARCLAAAGQSGAAKVEYRLACSYGDTRALAEAATRFPDLFDLLDITPTTPDGLMALGRLLRPDRPGDAALVFQRATEDFGEDLALMAFAEATLADGKEDQALALARRRSSTSPSDPEAWRLAALILMQAERYDEAEEELEKGLAAVPGAPRLAQGQVEIALRQRRFPLARQLAESMTCSTPTELATRQLLVARAWAGMGRYSDAISRAQSAVAMVPGNPTPLAILSSIYAQAGRFDDAVAALQSAAALPGQDPAAYKARLDQLSAERDIRRERRTSEELGR